MRHFALPLAVAAAAALVAAGTGCTTSGHGHDHAGHHGYHEHPFERMPADVQAAVKRDYPGATVTSAGSEFSDKDETAHYHVKLRMPDGKMVQAEYDQSGRKLAD